MRIVDQRKLGFRQGTSDKVYEVDLCEVGADQFVVNFRYGRRGSVLREGTKTTDPVPRVQAERIFTDLVESKLAKGYARGVVADPAQRSTAAAGAPAGPAAALPDDRPVARAILARLRDAQPPFRTPWNLDRVIWRAGVSVVREAEPELIRLLDAPNQDRQLRRYCVAWALGRLGRASSAQALRGIFADRDNRPATRFIAAEALLQVLTEPEREEFRASIAAELPQPLRDLAVSGPAASFTTACFAHLEAAGDPLILYRAYLLDSEHTRPAVLALGASAEFTRHTYRLLRLLFKAAAYRGDPEVFATLARRFEKERSGCCDEGVENRSRRAFGPQTRNYLRRRTWHELRHLGSTADPRYVPMATALLLRYADADAEPVRQSGTVFWGPFAPYLAFNHILFGNSPRFYRDRSARFFRARQAEPGAPVGREESFPALWDQAPESLLRLLEQSSCLPVHEFAVLALRENRGFVRDLGIDAIVLLLNRPYPVTAGLGFELAQAHYRADAPDLRLITSVALSAHPGAREQGRQWLEAHRALIVRESELLADLLTTSWDDVRTFSLTLIRASTLDETVGQALVGRLLAALVAMEKEDRGIATDLTDLLARDLAASLRQVEDPLVLELLDHELEPVQQLAADIARTRADAGRGTSDQVLAALLGAPLQTVRAAGVRLLEQLSDEELATRPELLYSLARHANDDLRTSIHPVVARVAATRPEFARAMANLCLGGLRFKAEEGVHRSLLELLKDQLHAALTDLGKEDIFGLLQARFSHAQEVGGVLLAERIRPEDLSVREIVRLANHDVAAVRRTAWSMCERSLDRLTRTLPVTSALLDARWEDSRQFAMRLFREQIAPAMLTPDALVAICDSVRPDVQSFGRSLITERFRDEDGPTYLLKLSEHPTEALQLFATNYLTRFAADDPERLAGLEPYFVSVLSRVHRARVAKNRCLAFLEAEGLKSRPAAEIAARILTRQSVTMAIQNKGKMIATMLRLRQAYPDLDLPITMVAPARRGGTRGAV